MWGARARAERKLAFVKAHMRADDAWTEITIANVSSTGIMVKCLEPPAVGSEVELRRRGTTITGQVVWATPHRFGVHSFGEIDCDTLLAHSELQADRRAL